MKSKKGFTLVEMLTVLAIVIILSTALVMSVTDYIDNANTVSANASQHQNNYDTAKGQIKALSSGSGGSATATPTPSPTPTPAGGGGPLPTATPTPTSTPTPTPTATPTPTPTPIPTPPPATGVVSTTITNDNGTQYTADIVIKLQNNGQANTVTVAIPLGVTEVTYNGTKITLTPGTYWQTIVVVVPKSIDDFSLTMKYASDSLKWAIVTKITQG